jgi:LCP family protein required for cell wall assembly
MTPSEKLNLLDVSSRPSQEPKSQRGRIFYGLIFTIVFASFFGLGRLSLSETAAAALAGLGDIPFLKQMNLIVSPDRQLIGEAEDRVNIMLLGMGGAGHDGPLLTDTIMVMSVRPSDSRVAMLSIPRDLLVPLGDHGWRKINAANAYGELDAEGGGPELARTALEGLLGLEIPYYVRADFSGFRQLIDDIGGIDVHVDTAFTDWAYPDNNHGYQVVRFQEGWQHMEGETALQFSRSRHGNNGEGSDFARAARQQKVLLAVKDKVLTLRLTKDPGKITAMLGTLSDNIATNLQLGEILRLAKIGRAVDPGAMVHKVIGDGPESPLRATFVNEAYVLVPKKNDWEPLRTLAVGIFDDESDIELEEAPTQAEVAQEAGPEPAEIKLEVLNGTFRAGLAGRTATRLRNFGYQVVNVANAGDQQQAKTTIYDMSGGQMGASIGELQAALGVSNPTITVADNGQANGSADLMIVLGTDAPG